METIVEQILRNHSGYSKVPCSLCKRLVTNAGLKYSMRKYKEPLCHSCQALRSYGKGGEKK